MGSTYDTFTFFQLLFYTTSTLTASLSLSHCVVLTSKLISQHLLKVRSLSWLLWVSYASFVCSTDTDFRIVLTVMLVTVRNALLHLMCLSLQWNVLVLLLLHHHLCCLKKLTLHILLLTLSSSLLLQHCWSFVFVILWLCSFVSAVFNVVKSLSLYSTTNVKWWRMFSAVSVSRTVRPVTAYVRCWQNTVFN